MSDENANVINPTPPEGTSAPESAPASEASDAWRSVVAELDALGEAISRWAKAAVNDPDNKRRVDELSARLDRIVSSVGASIKGVSESEVAESFRDAAEATGDAFRTAGEKISGEVGPRLANAFKTVGDKLRSAGEHIEEKSAPDAPPTGPTVVEVPPAVVPSAEEPKPEA